MHDHSLTAASSLKETEQRAAVASVERAIAAIAAGQMVILIDDEDRENEGDLCMAADKVRPEDINFMATHGRGLICLALSEAHVRRLQLPMMVADNRAPLGTAFTVSIEAKDGVTTGISAADRAHTIRTAVAAHAKPGDVVSPGHVFPLRARPGGVLQRTGQTEGSVDLCRLANCDDSAVICEIMNDDGTMARYQDLKRFSQEHNIPMLTIADLVQYRLHRDRLVVRRSSHELRFASGRPWVAHIYESTVETRQMLALCFGDIGIEPMPVRVHTVHALRDIFDLHDNQHTSVRDAIAAIEKHGHGVFLFLPRKMTLAEEIAQIADANQPETAQPPQAMREFGLGAQVLSDLGLKKIQVMTRRPRRLIGLEAFGLEVVGQIDSDT